MLLLLFYMNVLCVSIIVSIMVGVWVVILLCFLVFNFWQEVECFGVIIVLIFGGMGGFFVQVFDNEVMKCCYGQIYIVCGNFYIEEIKKIWCECFGIKLVGGNGYGLIEVCVIIFLVVGEYVVLGFFGKCIVDFDVCIVDDNDYELLINIFGEIVVWLLCLDIMFQGYWNCFVDILKLMCNMWFYMGDIGKFDENGFFYFVDCKKDYLC